MLFANKRRSVYCSCMEFWSAGTSEFSEDILSCWLVVEGLLFQEVVEMLEKVVICWRGVW